jgi:hypothetical protein
LHLLLHLLLHLHLLQLRLHLLLHRNNQPFHPLLSQIHRVQLHSHCHHRAR